MRRHDSKPNNRRQQNVLKKDSVNGKAKKKLVTELFLKDGYPSDHIRQHHYTRPLLHHCSALRISCGKAGGAWDRQSSQKNIHLNCWWNRPFQTPLGELLKTPGDHSPQIRSFKGISQKKYPYQYLQPTPRSSAQDPCGGGGPTDPACGDGVGSSELKRSLR